MLSDITPQIAAWTESGRNDNAVHVGLVRGVDNSLGVQVQCAQNVYPTTIVIRWSQPLPLNSRILGDHWERAYGDLEWRGLVPERVLPWYFICHEMKSEQTRGIGVATSPASFCSWRADETGIMLVLDVRSGGSGVRLNGRTLLAATVMELESTPNEDPFLFARRFCKLLCKTPRLQAKPVYGGNDWYFRYGHNSAETVIADSSLVRELSPSIDNDPTFVIDDGWYPKDLSTNPLEKGTPEFPSMATLASQLKNNGVRPGIWVRPLVTTAPVPASCKMTSYQPAAPASILDPSVPETLRLVQADIARLRNWGYEVIKHDFTTFDITGHWGSTMGPQITNDGWSFADNSLTTAEIVKNLYVAIREAAGDALILGCNTIGHISAGLFEMQRTGDDTSGRHFERTRRMGVNALAFRMPQHRTFFDTDADCVGLTHDIPWEQNRQWLDLVGRSSTSLFVSCDPTAIGPDQRAALRDSFERAARPATPAEPVDWIETTCPRYWRAGDKRLTYNWEVFPGAAFACPG